jgi:Icc-related predicted phosphoesterase
MLWALVRGMNLLTISDEELSQLYGSHIRERFSGVDIILSCGDLSYTYLEYIVSMLDKPLFYVRGNHANLVEHTINGPKLAPSGGVDIHRKTVSCNGLLIAGIEGCGQYNYGSYQYSQREMWMWAYSLVPGLLINHLRYGRYLDVFITHAPPAGIHDMPDLPHRGIKAFNWIDRVFKPKYHFHGHIHVYRNSIQTSTKYFETTVVNTYGYKQTNIEVPIINIEKNPKKL